MNDSVSLSVQGEETNFLFKGKTHKVNHKLTPIVASDSDDEEDPNESKLRHEFNLNSPNVLSSKSKVDNFILQEDEEDYDYKDK